MAVKEDPNPLVVREEHIIEENKRVVITISNNIKSDYYLVKGNYCSIEVFDHDNNLCECYLFNKGNNIFNFWLKNDLNERNAFMHRHYCSKYGVYSSIFKTAIMYDYKNGNKEKGHLFIGKDSTLEKYSILGRMDHDRLCLSLNKKESIKDTIQLYELMMEHNKYFDGYINEVKNIINDIRPNLFDDIIENIYQDEQLSVIFKLEKQKGNKLVLVHN